MWVYTILNGGGPIEEGGGGWVFGDLPAVLLNTCCCKSENRFDILKYDDDVIDGHI